MPALTDLIPQRLPLTLTFLFLVSCPWPGRLQSRLNETGLRGLDAGKRGIG